MRYLPSIVVTLLVVAFFAGFGMWAWTDNEEWLTLSLVSFIVVMAG